MEEDITMLALSLIRTGYQIIYLVKTGRCIDLEFRVEELNLILQALKGLQNGKN